MSVDPRLRVAFLLGSAVGIFFVHDVRLLAGAVGLLAIGWLAVKLPPKRLLRQIFKLWGLAVLLAISYGLFDEEGHFGWHPDQLIFGTVMFLRILAIVLASQIARAGDPSSVAAGLAKLKIPDSVALPIDTVLALLGNEERHDGSGGGRGRNRGAEPQESFFQAAKKLARGDVAPVANKLELQIDRAERYLHREKHAANAKDLAVIAGLSLTMLGIKALKVLPNIPFAPGHKLVLLTPLYIVARLKTKMRAGASLTGLTMGFVAFLMGDGKYGVFEILKHVTPGIVCDLYLPRRSGPLGWSLYGGLIAASRFATIFAITLLVQAPAVAYAILIPGLTVHLIFGVASGYVTHHLVRAIEGKELT